jgi:Cdc6-like AAA superfamily ATPase
VQYTAGAEAWECVATNAMVFYSLNYSYKINDQAKGRIDRMNTKYVDLYYYILRSSSLIDTGIAKAIATKQNFNEKDFLPFSHYDLSFEPYEETELDKKYAELTEAALV